MSNVPYTYGKHVQTSMTKFMMQMKAGWTYQNDACCFVVQPKDIIIDAYRLELDQALDRAEDIKHLVSLSSELDVTQSSYS